jgi:hypothetical protein
MQHPDGLPILGQASRNGGANVAAIDKKYMVELTTVDGAKHRKTFDFARPEMRGVKADGTVDLGQIRDFDPRAQTIANISRALVAGVYGNPESNPPMIIVDGGAAVVWRHVVSFRYLGAADELSPAAGEAA